MKTDPSPGVLCTATRPPWLCVTCLTMEKPNPVPPVALDQDLPTL